MTINIHRLYTKYCQQWQFYRRSYEGGLEYLEHYIFQHAKEQQKYHKQRIERAVYPNHVKAIIDTYAAHLYREAINRNVEAGNADRMSEFWSDVDLLGNPADEFYERCAQLVQRDGRCAVVVDRTDPGRPMTSRADEMASGVRPYAYAVEAENIVDWDVDRIGRMNWCVVREVADQQRTWTRAHQAQRYQYRVWYPDRWELYIDTADSPLVFADGTSSNVRLVDQGTHPVGEVPIAWVYWGAREGVEPVADSAIKDLAPMNRRLCNFYSLIDEQIYQYVFSIMAVPMSTWDQLKKVDWSISGAIPFKDDVANPPFYLAPDIAQIEAIQAQIDKTEDQMRVLSGIGRVNEETKSVKSGIALSYLTMDKQALLSKFAMRMSRLEERVDTFAQRWMEVEGQTSRTYPTTFDPVDVQKELEEAILALSLGADGKYRAELLVQSARTHLGSKVSSEQLKEIEDDIRMRAERDPIMGNVPPA